MKLSHAYLTVMLHGNKELLLMEFQPALSHAPLDNSGDLMTKHAVLNALLQESKIQITTLIFVEFLVHLDNLGETRTANVFLLATILGKQSLKMVFSSARSHAQPDGGEMKISHVNLPVLLHGFKALPLMVSQLALDHALLVNSIDLMTTPAALNAMPQESKILATALIFAQFLVHLDNHGEMKTANAFLLATILGRPLLKMVFSSARSHAQPDRGGEMRIRLVNLIVMLHGIKALPLTEFQLALDHALLDSSTDLTTTPAALNALPQESRTLITVSAFADLLAKADSGGKMKTLAVTQSAASLGFL